MNTAYIVQRLLLALLVVWGVTVVVFMIVHIVPGDPARIILGPYQTEERVQAIRERLGLNLPVGEQYVNWLTNLFRGNLGSSLITSQPVTPQLMQRLGPTLELGLASLLVGMAIAFPIGIYSAINPGSKLDIATSIFSQLGISIPTFWLGILFVLFLAKPAGIFPPSGYTPIGEGLGDWFAHLILPALTSGLVSASVQTRFIRSAMLDVMNMDYIRTARAKGLPEGVVINRHALSNAMINIVTIIGLQMTALFSGLVITEVVFAWPGLGRLALDAVLDRDYPMLQGSVLIIALIVAFVNLMIDLSYFFLDPRIEYA